MDEFKKSLWIIFRELQTKFSDPSIICPIERIEKANDQINKLTNVELIDELTS